MPATPMTAQEIAHAVSLTLGGQSAAFDIEGIVEEIRASHAGITSIDDIPGETYWALVESHDNGAVTTYTYTRDNDNPEWGTDTITMIQRDNEVSERSHKDGIDSTDDRGFSSEFEAAEHIRERGVYLESEGYTRS